MTGELWTDYHTVEKKWAGPLCVGGTNENKHGFSQGSSVSAHLLKESVRFLVVYSLHTLHTQIRYINRGKVSEIVFAFRNQGNY